MTILEKIHENANQYPDRNAYRIVTPAGDHSISWSELENSSDRLASYFLQTLKTDTPVVVYGHKDPYMLVCFLACVKSGRAYCPVDINVPLSRVEAIIEEVHPEIILCTEELELKYEEITGLDEIRRLAAETPVSVTEKNHVGSGDVFYIIFTSGSTGTPKGVQITRDCLDNFIRWALTLGNGFDDGVHRVFLNQAPFSFDLSVMDLFLSLYTGGTLHAIPKDMQGDMKALLENLKSSGGNVWVSTPSFADVCLSDPSFSGDLLPGLTDFLFCGEILTNKTAERLSARFPSAKIVNTYGPTESTCAVTQVEITPEINATQSPLPVGRAKAGTWIRIMDESGNTVPDGERGEIVIIGDSVSVGYWHNEEKNRAAFGTTTVDGTEYRFYKTGDEGYLVDGMLHYGGRMDNQIKLHGYRIELEDIESNLLKLEGIRQAVCVPKYRDGKVSSIAAGVVAAAPVADEKAEVSRIKQELGACVPDYMIPKKIRFLEDIPMTNNGKADRKMLGGLL